MSMEKNASNQESDQKVILLGEVSKQTGLDKQYIINLIKRFKVISPEKIGHYGIREAYGFTQAEVDRIKQVAALASLHYPPRDIGNMLGQEEDHSLHTHELVATLSDWDRTANPENREAVLNTLLSSPLMGDQLTSEEEAVLNVKFFPEDLEEPVELDSEEKKKLASAYQKIGRAIVMMLDMGTVCAWENTESPDENKQENRE